MQDSPSLVKHSKNVILGFGLEILVQPIKIKR